MRRWLLAALAVLAVWLQEHGERGKQRQRRRQQSPQKSVGPKSDNLPMQNRPHDNGDKRQ